MKVKLSKTEIKTICSALDTAAKKCHSALENSHYFTAANQMRIFQLAQMYETLSEKLKAVSAGEDKNE